MGKMPVDEFVKNVLSYMGTLYDKLDCSGLLNKASDGRIYHGSNTIWRTELTEKGSISDHGSSNGYPKNINPLKSTQLKVGMAVFKWNPNDVKNDGLGDYQHIGVVTGVNPLVITHSSYDTECVTQDKKVGKWCAWGLLTDIDYGAEAEPPQEGEHMGKIKLKIKASPSLLIRGGPSTKDEKLGSIKNGATVYADYLKDGWFKLADRDGWVCAQYCKVIKATNGEPAVPDDVPSYDVDPETGAVPDELPDNYVDGTIDKNGILDRLDELQERMDEAEQMIADLLEYKAKHQ